jgi:hypothetical protein
MMRIGDLTRADRLARDMRSLEGDRDSGKFGVTINGRYQDDDVLAVIQGAIKGELQRRIDLIAAELIGLGVDVDRPA